MIQEKSYSLPTLQHFITHETTKVNKEGNPVWKQIKSSQSISNLRGETSEGDMKVLSFCLSGVVRTEKMEHVKTNYTRLQETSSGDNVNQSCEQWNRELRTEWRFQM